MAQQNINIGAAANDGTGDQLRTAFTKSNANFTEVYGKVAALDAVTGDSVLAKTGAGAGAFTELAAGTNSVLRRVAGALGFGLLSKVHLNVNIVDNTILSQVAQGIFKGRKTAGVGNVEDLTATDATSLLDVFTMAAKGLAPASGGGTANYLRADGTWAAPAGGGSDAHDVQMQVRNNTGASLAALTPVALGSDSGLTTPNVVPAVGSGAMPCIGITIAAIANAATGAVMRSGLLTGLNTSSYTFAAPLYIAAAGGLTATRPTSGSIQVVAYVTRVHATTGEIFVALGDVGQLISALTVRATIDGTEKIPISGDEALTTAQLIAETRKVDYIAETTTARTFASTDNGKVVGAQNAAATVFTIPANATVALPVGFTVNLARDTAATATLTAAAGVSLNGVTAGSTTISTQYRGVITLHKTATDTWFVRGDCPAVA